MLCGGAHSQGHAKLEHLALGLGAGLFFATGPDLMILALASCGASDCSLLVGLPLGAGISILAGLSLAAVLDEHLPDDPKVRL